ncbi:MAG TPA: NAD(P)/FAD-dependent oxidoreductase [Thermomicrobiales bacterium]|nr:NAD(P)/FAD-dependent oxidoreductase [Thermomicrobiales bacterium]
MTRSTDIAIVGAGPAGIGAALAAARNGARVVIIDENSALGGHLRWTMARQSGFGDELDGLRGHEIASWATGLLANTGVEVLTSAVAWGLFDDNALGVLTADSSFQLHADRVIIATGSTDLTWPFPGWELPGIVTATCALRLLHLDRVLPGRRVAVVGAGSLAEQVVADLHACGGIAVARLPAVSDVTVGGSDRVEWIDDGGQRTVCDTVVLALGRQPDAQLALQAQVALTYSVDDGVFVAARDEALATSVAGVYVVGDAGGVNTPARAFAEGAVAGEAATGGTALASALERLRTIGRQTEPYPPLPAIADDTMVCRCEEVRANVLRAAIRDGAISLNDLKRRTRAGMGVCQGIYCNRAMAGMIASEAGVPIGSVVSMTARPPARLIPMAAMADLEP